MSVEADVREIRGHVLNLVGAMGRLEGTLKAHERPCSDVKTAHIRLDKMETARASGGTAELVKQEQSIVKLLLVRVVGPLVAAVSGVLAYVFATNK